MPSIVDSHQHFWRLDRGDYGWLNAAAVAPLRRDFLPADLLPELKAHGIQQTVLVQATNTLAETDYLLELADENDFIAGVVGWVDLSRPTAVAHLERWHRNPKFKGVRAMLQDLPEADWIARRPDVSVMQALQAMGLRLDALVRPEHLPHLLAMAQRWPDLQVLIDHAAKPQLASGWDAPWAARWREDLRALAALPQVSCKLSGLLTECAECADDTGLIEPVWAELLHSFGPERLLWGSDWPVLNLAGSYTQWLELSRALMQGLPEAQRDAILGGNARRFYALPGDANG